MLKRSKHKEAALLYQQNKTLEEVGKILGISRQAVQQRLIIAGVERRYPYKFAGITKTVLTNLYIKQGLSTAQISQKIGCSRETIAKYLRRYGIKLRSPSDALKLKVKNPDLTEEKLRQLYFEEGKTMTEIARLTRYSQARISELFSKYELKARKPGRRKK